MFAIGVKFMVSVIVVNGSPHGKSGVTGLILDPFVTGMCDAGADIEQFELRRLTIGPCTGEFHCWTKTPGQCYQDDDMTVILPKLARADIWVIASPVYVDGLTGQTKQFLDRTLPLLQPFYEFREGHCRHPLRDDVNPNGQLVLVSNAGFWEMDNFTPIILHMQAYCRNMSRAYAGALLRPHGPALRAMQAMGAPVDDVLDAVKDAGRQLIDNGVMTENTLNTISRPLLSAKDFAHTINQRFKQARAQSTMVRSMN
jgi:multimeric flavodoxin WrbA